MLVALGVGMLPSACGRRLTVTETTDGGAFSDAGATDSQGAATTGGPGGGNSGAASNRGGSFTQGGATAGAAGASEPATALDYCAMLQPEFDSRRCVEDEDCTYQTCDCGSFGYLSLRYCEPTEGCLVGLSCEAYCSQRAFGSVLPETLDCALKPCREDTDCVDETVDLLCVRSETAELGFCRERDGRVCIDSDDCPTGSTCTLAHEGGTRVCLAAGDHCTNASDCGSDQCAIATDSYVGKCTPGGKEDRCYEHSDCDSPLRCVRVLPDQDTGQCWDGTANAWCTSDDDCREGRCFPAGFDHHARCSTGKVWETCSRDSDCDSKACILNHCSDGSQETPCETPDDCLNGARCIRNLCHDGQLNSACREDTDCLSGFCADRLCTDGLPGSDCDEDADCVSGECDYAEGMRCK